VVRTNHAMYFDLVIHNKGHAWGTSRVPAAGASYEAINIDIKYKALSKCKFRASK